MEDRYRRIIEAKLAGATYQAISDREDVTRQRIQQILAPSPNIRRLVIKRAGGKCEECGTPIGLRAFPVHHKACTFEDYNKPEFLELVCSSCHRALHAKEPEELPQTEAPVALRKGTLGMVYHCLRPECDHHWLGRLLPQPGQTEPPRPKQCPHCTSRTWWKPRPPSGKKGK